MSEKKYYVMASGRNHLYFHYETDSGEFAWCEEKDCYRDKCKMIFTKSELTEIMDGEILKRIPGGTNLEDLGKDKSYYVWIEDCNYWKNPFIELVPVEDGE